MIKAKQVPNEAWMAMQSVIGDHVSVATQKEAIAAAINAWPGVCIRSRPTPHPKTGEYTIMQPMLSLPLTQESGNE